MFWWVNNSGSNIAFIPTTLLFISHIFIQSSEGPHCFPSRILEFFEINIIKCSIIICVGFTFLFWIIAAYILDSARRIFSQVSTRNQTRFIFDYHQVVFDHAWRLCDFQAFARHSMPEAGPPFLPLSDQAGRWDSNFYYETSGVLCSRLKICFSETRFGTAPPFLPMQATASINTVAGCSYHDGLFSWKICANLRVGKTLSKITLFLDASPNAELILTDFLTLIFISFTQWALCSVMKKILWSCSYCDYRLCWRVS